MLDGVVYSAMVGLGFAVTENVTYYLAVAVQSARWRVLPPAVGLLGAIGLHGLWNAAGLTGGGFVLVYVGVFVPLFLVMVTVAIRATRREGRLLRRHLAEEVEADRLTPEEIDTLTSLRRRRRAERASAPGDSPDAKHVRRSFHHAATQLAFTRHRRRTGHLGRTTPPADVEQFWQAETQRRRRLVCEPGPSQPARLEPTT